MKQITFLFSLVSAFFAITQAEAQTKYGIQKGDQSQWYEGLADTYEAADKFICDCLEERNLRRVHQFIQSEIMEGKYGDVKRAVVGYIFNDQERYFYLSCFPDESTNGSLKTFDVSTMTQDANVSTALAESVDCPPTKGKPIS